ncbi:acyltransferase family protein [Pseudonocardia parietis]|uniref:Peptidoglycan/LPS O-acetylase OafA/YrhL n=1 Tax=Pseudonocardia parietis TaxID=570936 RepID=A0ABS4VL42_9PSEU|nr:acyltransferase [Pseudonocardia parietis]MBP2364642.1 peptidoglycan/LPS O-acetylase OafA/YrhL [Pseudonocardia parietis]
MADATSTVPTDPADAPSDRRGSSVLRAHGEVRALTGLRIVAALWVVAFHFHFTALSGVETVNAWLGPLVTQGALGVDLFFVLSGFVIAWTYLDQLGPRLRVRDAGSFVWARAARMWPAYAVVLHLFGVWLVARAVLGSGEQIAYQAVQPELSAGAWLEQVLLVQMWNEPYLDGASWVGPTWSISAEWLAYLLFPLLAVVFFRLRNLPFVVLAAGSLACVAPIAAAFVVVGSPYYPYSWLVRVLGGFSAGVLAMLAVRRLRGSSVPAVASSTATLVAAAVPFVLLAGSVYGSGLHGLTVLLFPVLVGALALADRGPVHHLLTRRSMVHGGHISYALYLVHIPMFEIFWFLSEKGVLPAGGETGHLIALTVFVGTLPVAHLMYTLVERPARRWMRALSFRRTTAAAPEVRTAVGKPVDNRVDGVGGRPVTTDDARCDPATSVFPVIAPALAAEPAPAASVPWALDRLAAARAAGRAGPTEGVSADLVALARMRSGGPGSGADLFRPLVDGPGAADRVERLRSLQVAARAAADGGDTRGGVVPAPRALRSAAALPGTRSGAEHCGRASRRRDDTHGSAATPIVAASGAAGRRRRKRPAHGV